MIEFITHTETETESVGRQLAVGLVPGDVVLLSGPLGAGKTALTRGLAAGLGCDPTAVSSPTFTLIQEYEGRLPLQHVDLYRLAPEEVDDLALEDLLEHSVMAIEWPERWRRAPAAVMRITIEQTGESSRRIAVEPLPRAGQRSTR